MTTLADIRTQYPELEGLDDSQAIDAIHQAFYPDVPREAIEKRLGYTAPEPPREPSSMLRRVVGDTGVSLMRGAVAVPEAVVGVADLVTGGRAGRMAERAGFRPKEAKQILGEYYSPEQKQAFQEVQDAEGVVDTAGAVVRNPSVIAQTVAESLPSMGAGGVVARGARALAPGLSPVLAGAAGEGVVSAGSSAEQVRQDTSDGLLTGEQAAITGASGAATGVLGLFGAKLAKSLGVADVDTLLAGAAKSDAVRKSVVRRAIEGFVSEGILEELPQSLQEQVAQNAALGKPWDEGVDQAAVLGVLSGGLIGAGVQLLPERGPMSRAANAGIESGTIPAGMPGVAPQPAGAPLEMDQQPWAPPVDAGPGLAPAPTADGLPFEADPTFEQAPVHANGAAPASRQFGTQQAADIAIGEQGLMASHAAVETAPGVFEIRPKDAPAIAMVAPGVYEAPASESAPVEKVVRPTPAPPVAATPEASPVETPALPVSEPAPVVSEPETLGDYPDEKSAREYISRQRRAASANLPPALPWEREDGSFSIATEGSPGWEEAQGQEVPRKRAAAGIKPDDVTRADGEPFLNKVAAVRAAKKLAGSNPVEVKGGWVVRPAPVIDAALSNGAPVAGEALDEQWTAFAPESGTLNVPRSEMPQIKAGDRSALVQFLRARGIAHATDVEIPAADLKPTQAEFSPSKVGKAQAFEGGDRSILVSSDGYVLDGHHQWLAKLDAGQPVKAIRLDAPIDKLMDEVRQFPSASTADGATPAAEPVAEAPAAEADGHGGVGGVEAPDASATTAETPQADDTNQPSAAEPEAQAPADEAQAAAGSDGEAGSADAAPAGPADVQAAGVEAAPEPAAKPTPRKRNAPGERARAARLAKLTDYFTPGNVVKGYVGHDRVLAFEPDAERGGWSVQVQHVIAKGGQWITDPRDSRERWHSTEPTEKELAAGPVLRAPVDQEPGEQQAEMLESRLGRLFTRFGRLGNGPGTATQGLDDAAQILNLPRKPRLVKNATLAPYTLAAVDLKTGDIHWNPNQRDYTRAEWAQIMAEELMHAADRTGPDTAMSATSERLLPGGDIEQEARSVFDGGKGLADFFSYPFDDKRHGALSPQRIAAELFARLAVIYHGDQALMKRSLPVAYEAYHDIFGRIETGPDQSVSRRLPGSGRAGRSPVLPADPGAPDGRDGQARLAPRPDAGTPADRRRGSGGEQADHGLGVLHAALARVFRADASGGVVAGGAAESRPIAGQPASDKKGRPPATTAGLQSPGVGQQAAVPTGTEFATERGAGIDLASAQAFAKTLTDQGLVRLNVVQSIADMPDLPRERVLAQAPDGRVRGAYLRQGDSIWLIADHIRGAEEFLEVAVHEAFHRGLARTIPEAKPLLREMWRTNQALRAATAAQEKAHGIARDEAIEEALAVMAERGEARDLSGWGKLLDAIRGWLGKLASAVGIEMAWTDDMVADFVAGMTREGLQGGVHVSPAESQAMLSRSEVPDRGINLQSVRETRLPAGYILNDLFQSDGKIGWWQKTVGTPYNLAQRSAPFKRVYDATQNFLGDVSHYATEAADLAPSILPKLDKLSDITKSPISAEDSKAIAAPIFEGTLIWARDENGKAVKVGELETAAARMTADEKAQQMVRAGRLENSVLTMWKGLPIDQFDAMVDTRYTSEMLKAGVVFTDEELARLFKATPKQAALYREFRKATDLSLTRLAISDMLRLGGKDVAAVRDQALAIDDVSAAASMLSDHLVAQAEQDAERADVLNDTAARIVEKAERATDLMRYGYAPLSRFGDYTVYVTEGDEQRYFGMFESKAEANRMARQMRAQFPGATITQGTVSQEAFKLFAGVSPETLELFGDMLGLEAQGNDAASKAFQTYLKIAKANRSAMKRLIHRKGVAGFSEDAGRVLAGFLYSNARQTSGNLHMGEITEAVSAIPQGQGELKDYAVRLTEYVKNPREEAQAFRGLLFAQYLGGSVASAMVNMSQPVTVTFPYLSQFGGAAKAAAQITRAMANVAKGATGDKALDEALKKAEADGIVSPQEVFQLMAQAQGRGSLRSGDGTMAGNAAAKFSNSVSRFSLAWGKLFGFAEQINRRTTFIAAYRTAVDQGIAEPAKFAEKAVAETQFVFNKGNKVPWARGAIGGTLMTFKAYSINYLELLARMARSGPEGRNAAVLAVAVLFLMSGADGLPFMEDAEDALDGFMQRVLGLNFSAKNARDQFLEDLFGRPFGRFMEKGVSGLPGVPIDLSGRMGMGNLLPGTGMLTKKTDYTRDLAELTGPSGDFAKRSFQAAGKALTGDVAGAARTISPVAARNAVKAVDMYTTGLYKDDDGNKILDVDRYEAFAKLIGFQPGDVARTQDANWQEQRSIALVKLRESEIAAAWARGIVEGDRDKVLEAREMLKDWNRKNPDSRINISIPQLRKRVHKMRQSKAERIEASAPKEIRARVRAELAGQ